MFPLQLHEPAEEESETETEGHSFVDQYPAGRVRQSTVKPLSEAPLEFRLPCVRLETGTRFSGGHSLSQVILQNRAWESQVPALQKRLSYLLERLVEFLPRGLIDSINSEVLRFPPAQECKGDQLLSYWLGVYYEFLRRRGDIFSRRLLVAINEKFETELTLSGVKTGWYQHLKQLPKGARLGPTESRRLLFLGIRRKIMQYTVAARQDSGDQTSEDVLRTALSLVACLENKKSYFPQDPELVALSCYTLAFTRLRKGIDWSGTDIDGDDGLRKRVIHHRCRISQLLDNEEGSLDG